MFLTGFHLPDIDSAVSTANDNKIIMRTPLDDMYWKQLTRCQQYALVITQWQQWQRMIIGHRTDTHLHSRLQSHSLLAMCRPSGCTVVSGVVVGVCNCCQMRTSKCTCLNFGVSIGLDPGEKCTKGIFDRSRSHEPYRRPSLNGF